MEKKRSSLYELNVWNWFVDTTAGWSTLGVAFRLLSALIVGLTVGIDREMKRRGADIKTHVSVCLGAALVMITSQYLMENFDGSTDISRMGAQVISGGGFLGVGTIIVTGCNQGGDLRRRQAYGYVPASDWQREQDT